MQISENQIKVVPALRDELRLIPAENNRDGSPAWMVQDPIKNKFYRIGWLEFELLSRWHLGEIADITQSVVNETTLYVDDNDVVNLILFLNQNKLLRISDSRAVAAMMSEANQSKLGFFSWLIHHYLFFRIPIIRPQYLLKSILPMVRWVFSPAAVFVVLAITISGILLVLRQWDTFKSTFLDQMTLAGLMSYALALVFSKTFHEIGHAVTATHYGVRVGHMGIAMLVMFPMPYTDTSESWKLTNANQRMHIASAGIIAELALAGIATFAWCIAPEGAAKSALYFLATTSWVLTLLVNLSPFMRFDGYFILSDLLDYPNLHGRSAAMALTGWRRFLLGFKDGWPEAVSSKARRALISFATFTWFYRVTVFIGIAWLVYYYFFKVLGIILFLIEIIWFVLLPIWREFKVWFERRKEIMISRLFMLFALIVFLIALGFVPWQSKVDGLAWLHAGEQTVIFTPLPGKLEAASKPGQYKKGESLFRLSSPDMALQAARLEALKTAKAAEIRSLSGLEDGETRRVQLETEKEKFIAEIKLYEDQQSRMDIAAPFDGELTDLEDNLSPNTWVHQKQALATFINPNSWLADVFIEEAEVARVRLGDAVTIYLLGTDFVKMTGKVTKIDDAKLQVLPTPMLNAKNGGEILTQDQGKDVPKGAYYRVRVALDKPENLTRVAVAHAAIETQAQAWLPKVGERIAALFIRESGF